MTFWDRGAKNKKKEYSCTLYMKLTKLVVNIAKFYGGFKPSLEKKIMFFGNNYFVQTKTWNYFFVVQTKRNGLFIVQTKRKEM